MNVFCCVIIACSFDWVRISSWFAELLPNQVMNDVASNSHILETVCCRQYYSINNHLIVNWDQYWKSSFWNSWDQCTDKVFYYMFRTFGLQEFPKKEIHGFHNWNFSQTTGPHINVSTKLHQPTQLIHSFNMKWTKRHVLSYLIYP